MTLHHSPDGDSRGRTLWRRAPRGSIRFCRSERACRCTSRHAQPRHYEMMGPVSWLPRWRLQAPDSSSWIITLKGTPIRVPLFTGQHASACTFASAKPQLSAGILFSRNFVPKHHARCETDGYRSPSASSPRHGPGKPHVDRCVAPGSATRLAHSPAVARSLCVLACHAGIPRCFRPTPMGRTRIPSLTHVAVS